MEMIQGQLMYVAASFVEGVFLYRTLVKTHVQRVIYEFFRLIFRPYVWIFKKIKGIQKKHLKS